MAAQGAITAVAAAPVAAALDCRRAHDPRVSQKAQSRKRAASPSFSPVASGLSIDSRVFEEISDGKSKHADPGFKKTYRKGRGAGRGPAGGGAATGGMGDPGMAADAAIGAINRQNLIKGYANMVARCWVDDSYLQLVLTNTAQTLADAGMPTVDGAVIRVIQHVITGSGKIEDQVDSWLRGNETGL